MLLYGVEKIVANYVNLGLKSWSNIGYTAMSIIPPKHLLDARNFMLRQMADRIIQFGILEITLFPSMTDIHTIQSRWAVLEGKKIENPGIPLNIETDPVSPDVIHVGEGVTPASMVEPTTEDEFIEDHV